MPLPAVNPPLVNSASPWATTTKDLQALFDSPSTGAVTTRTSLLLRGFEQDDTIHQYTFFSPNDHASDATNVEQGTSTPSCSGSLNTLGYSPIVLATYLTMCTSVIKDSRLPEDVRVQKPFIISVTGSSEDVVACYRLIQDTQATISNPLGMEVNLSCPNIPGQPPPAYLKSSLVEYLAALAQEPSRPDQPRVAIGIKTPPYTYHDQFQILVEALLASTPKCPVDFITATNTLGSSLILSDEGGQPALGSASGDGIGGMAGAPLHPLALGNVKTIRTMLDQHEKLRSIDVIGVGGVSDVGGFRRMLAVGAKVVGVGTGLGREGVSVFDKILNGSPNE